MTLILSSFESHWTVL